MQTQLAERYRDTTDGRDAEAILRKCVHCGFCTATCPTYQLLGDELDGPRGRIYLIKQVLEGDTPTRKTQQHLDRCLTCRNCESTCPSGVQYGQLLDIGRKLVDQQVPRPVAERALRWSLKEGLPSPLFAPAMKLGRSLRPLLPQALRGKLPEPGSMRERPRKAHMRKVLLPTGCVQPAMLPNIDVATSRVLDAIGIQTLSVAASCCGALRFHLNDQVGGRADMRTNIDAWWPLLQSGEVEAIVMNASGCGVMVKDYGHALKDDAAYAEKAQQVSAMTRDLSEYLPELAQQLTARVPGELPRLVFHPPCTLQHGQQLRGAEIHLRRLGFSIELADSESHLCCGSAGTYSVLQPKLAYALRDRKLEQLQDSKPQVIVSANVGCISHLQSGTKTPVRHWVEVLDDALSSTA